MRLPPHPSIPFRPTGRCSGPFKQQATGKSTPVRYPHSTLHSAHTGATLCRPYPPFKPGPDRRTAAAFTARRAAKGERGAQLPLHYLQVQTVYRFFVTWLFYYMTVTVPAYVTFYPPGYRATVYVVLQILVVRSPAFSTNQHLPFSRSTKERAPATHLRAPHLGSGHAWRSGLVYPTLLGDIGPDLTVCIAARIPCRCYWPRSTLIPQMGLDSQFIPV